MTISANTTKQYYNPPAPTHQQHQRAHKMCLGCDRTAWIASVVAPPRGFHLPLLVFHSGLESEDVSQQRSTGHGCMNIAIIAWRLYRNSWMESPLSPPPPRDASKA